MWSFSGPTPRPCKVQTCLVERSRIGVQAHHGAVSSSGYAFRGQAARHSNHTKQAAAGTAQQRGAPPGSPWSWSGTRRHGRPDPWRWERSCAELGSNPGRQSGLRTGCGGREVHRQLRVSMPTALPQALLSTLPAALTARPLPPHRSMKRSPSLLRRMPPSPREPSVIRQPAP